MSFFKKKRVKVQFDITIESVKWIFGYSKLAGKSFHAEWKKGDKEGNFGKSKSLKLEEDRDSINFDLKLKFNATVNYDGDISKSPKFKSKKIAFSLVADDAKDKGEALVGKAEFDLATVAQPGKFEPRQEIVLVGKDKKETNRSPRLQLVIKAEWIKLDGKKIVASSDSDSKDSKKKKSKDDDILGDLGDIADDVSAFKKKKESKKDKNKNPELALLEGSEGGGKKTIEINGVEHDLVDTDELSEIEEDWDGEKTDRDYLTDSDELGEDPFEEEERKEREEAAKKEAKTSRRASIANLSALEGSDGGDKKKHKDKKKLEDSLESSGSADPKASRKAKKEEEAKKKEEDEAAAKKKEEEEAAAKKKKEEEEAAAKKKKEEEDAKKKKEEEEAKAKKKLEDEKKKEEERLKREEERKKKKDEEEAARKKEEEEAKKKAEEKKKLEEEAKSKKESDDKKKKELDAAEEKKRKEAEDKKKKDEEAAAKKKREEEEAAAKKKKDEEAKKKKEEEDAAAKKKKDEEIALKKKKEEEEAAAKKKREEEEAAAKKQKDEEAKKKKEEEEAAAKKAEEPKSASPASSDSAKRSSIAERTAKWNTMITNPGGKPKDTSAKSEEKLEVETKKAASPPAESETKLAHPTADRAKPPPGRRPSMKRISRGNSEAEAQEAAGSSSDEDEAPVTKAVPVAATKSDDKQSAVVQEELAKAKADLSKAQDEASKLRKQLKEAQDQFDEALDEKNGEVADLKKKVQDLEDEIADLQDQLDEARNDSGKPAPSVDEASQREIKKLKETISSLEEKLKKAGQEVDSLKKELSAAKASAQKKSADDDDDDGDSEQTQGILKNSSSASEEQLSKMKAQLKLVQQQLDNRAKVVELLHTARLSYEAPDSLTSSSKKPPANSPVFRPSRSAFLLAEYLLEQNALDVEHQADAANQQVLKEILLGIQSQYLKSSDQADIGGQIGWLSYSASLLWALMRPGVVDEKIVGTEPDDDEEDEEDSSSSSSESRDSEGNGSEEEEEDEDEEEEEDEDESGSGSDSEESNNSETKGRKLQKIKKPKKVEKPPKPLKPRIPQHSLFWTLYMQERGIHCGYDDVKECLKDLAHLDVEEELAADEEDGPARRFLDVLDMLISHQYALLIDGIQKKIGGEKLVDVFFDQSAVLQAPSAPRKREPTQQRHQHSPTLITGQLDFVMQMFRKTHSFCKALEIQLCRAATAYSMKVALSHVEQWVAPILASSNLDQPLLSWVNERLEPLREAANVLLIDKHVFEEDVRSVFTALSIVQINRLLSQFAPDEFAPDKVPEDALRTVQKAANSVSDPKKKIVNVIATHITLLPKFV